MTKKQFIIILFLSSAIILNAQWIPMKDTPNTWATSMVEYNGNLYVAGGFQYHIKFPGPTGANMVGIGKWDGIGFDSVNTGVNGQGGVLTVFNNKLIISGSFSVAGNIPTNNIASWDGSIYDSLGGGISGLGVSSFAVYHNELYVGGVFNKAGNIPVKNIAKWNGTSWSAVGTGIHNEVWSMEVYNDELYVSGFIDTADGVPVSNIARYNGLKWDSVKGGLNGGAMSLKTYKNELYASGGFSSADGISTPCIARWNGTNWSPLAAGITATSTSRPAYGDGLQIYNNNLFVCGEFSKADTVAASNIAKWDGTKWDKLGLGTEILYGYGSSTHVSFPYNGDLYVTGLFNYLLTDTSYFMARYHEAGVGIEEFDNKNSFIKIFPNPTINILNLKLTEQFIGGNIQLFDAIGKVLQTQPINNTTEKINLNLNSGIYFIKATTKDSVSKTEKLVVE